MKSTSYIASNTSGNTSLKWLVLFIGLFCFAQLSSLAHSAQHDFHKGDELCETLISFQCSSLDTFTSIELPAQFESNSNTAVYTPIFVPKTFARQGQTRAPPAH